MQQIQTAGMSYYTEYSVYPIPAGQAASTDFVIADTDSATWGGMIYGLAGNINPLDGSTSAPGSAVPNTRAIAFLTLKSTDMDVKNGKNAPLNPLPPNTSSLYMNMAIDGDYDNILGTAPSAAQLPKFQGAVVGTDPPNGGTSTAGIALWANCNGNATTKNPSFWIHTY
ncbi:MAG: hypothetical protein WDO13_14875 [Verrucomicrobiota bacterium]